MNDCLIGPYPLEIKLSEILKSGLVTFDSVVDTRVSRIYLSLIASLSLEISSTG